MVAVVAVAVDVEDLGMPWRERERGERKGVEGGEKKTSEIGRAHV